MTDTRQTVEAAIDASKDQDATYLRRVRHILETEYRSAVRPWKVLSDAPRSADLRPLLARKAGTEQEEAR